MEKIYIDTETQIGEIHEIHPDGFGYSDYTTWCATDYYNTCHHYANTRQHVINKLRAAQPADLLERLEFNKEMSLNFLGVPK